MLETLITSKTRLKLLVKFFISAANQGYMRGLASEFNESTNAIRKELNNLSEAGYLEKEADGNRINYKANTKHPLFGSLQSIVRKYLGLDTLVEKVLDRMGKVAQIWLIGDYAKGVDSGVIEVVIVGEDLDAGYAEGLSRKLAPLIEREVRFTLREEDEGELEGLLLFEERE